MSLPVSVVQDRIEALDSYWRAANYLGAAQLYLQSNVLLLDPLQPSHVKRRPLGHWGTQPGLNLIYAHLNRLIAETHANLLLVVGPGHGAPAIFANLWLEGSLVPQPDITQFVKAFSWPGGAPSHLTAQTPGAIHEGGELGYSLAHAFGAVLDNPDLIAACVVGDGEAETGQLAASWRYNAFLNPRTSGAVLPILHLNGYKLSGPTLFGRMNDAQLRSYFDGLGFEAILADGVQLGAIHANVWEALDRAYGRIRAIQERFRMSRAPYGAIPRWPVVILRTEKGVTGPRAGTFHSHGLPLSDPATDLKQLAALERWLRSYRPEQLFDERGTPNSQILSLLPQPEMRMGRSRYANAGTIAVPLELAHDEHYREFGKPGSVRESPMERLGEYLQDVMRRNNAQQNFRMFCPDETISNKLQAIFNATDRAFMGPILDTDEYLAPEGRVIEILSEHCCEGWLEGYLLTGRHGLLACYEGFVPIVDSMVHQYGKWLKMSREVPWRAPVPSLNILLTSHVWRQDHNGFSHQAPGFIDSLLTNKSEITRAYLPPDANTMIATTDHCLRGRGEINLIVAGKNAMPQWLGPDEAKALCARGAGTWEWAGNAGEDPQIVLGCCGDVPTMETVAAAQILREHAPALRVRVVNVVDLMRIASPADHPHGIPEAAFAELFPADREVVFAFHGYPSVIHKLLHGRVRPERFHVRGYEEEGTTTTPFDMLVRNRMSRYHLVERAAQLACEPDTAARIAQFTEGKLAEHRRYIVEHGIDMPEVRV
ncbi:MAG TPA: phosphoketolase family protein [Candidatus Baltobacteraceae bacterium]|nr:phosphoketolase family protein [Candidatus Baltobacteraceae bacterium]